MSERYDLPRIRPNEQPSYLNHEAGLGSIEGLAIGILPATLLVATKNIKAATALLVGSELVGAVMGAARGKRQQEDEMIHGRVVKTPGYFNMGILSGMLASAVIHLPSSIAQISGAEFHLPMPLSWGIGIGCMAIGSILRKDSLQRDYDKAVFLRNQQELALMQAQGLTPGLYRNTVTPQEMLLMQQRLQNKPASAEQAPGSLQR